MCIRFGARPCVCLPVRRCARPAGETLALGLYLVGGYCSVSRVASAALQCVLPLLESFTASS
jgi:hypothetical protein